MAGREQEQIAGPCVTVSLVGTTEDSISGVEQQVDHEADQLPPSSVATHECVTLYLHSPIRLHSGYFMYHQV